MCQIIDVNEEAWIPCSWQGSIKYVHIACIEEWIKRSGAIEWEICHEMYSQKWVEWAIENNYVKKDEEVQEEEYEDIIDVYWDKLKYFFIFYLACFYLIFSNFLYYEEKYATSTLWRYRLYGLENLYFYTCVTFASTIFLLEISA